MNKINKKIYDSNALISDNPFDPHIDYISWNQSFINTVDITDGYTRNPTFDIRINSIMDICYE